MHFNLNKTLYYNFKIKFTFGLMITKTIGNFDITFAQTEKILVALFGCKVFFKTAIPILKVIS